jgi:uncharacterized protein YbjT (DUF2867 family)
MILVAGATGVLGGAIAGRLVYEGRSVRLLVRDAARVKELAATGAQVAVGDLTDRPSLDRAMSGVTHVITTANAFMARSRRAVERIDIQGNRNLIDAAKAARVRQFVFTSAWLPDAYLRIDYFAAKRRTEDHLRASGVRWTILRPAAFMETWALVIGEPILKSGATQIFGSGTNPINFVAVDDVAAIAVQALDRPEALNTSIDIPGPENLTQLEVAAVFERITGRLARKRHLPVPMMRLTSAVLRPFNPVFARQLAAGALMATVPQAIDPTDARARWNVPMTRMEDWARGKYVNP